MNINSLFLFAHLCAACLCVSDHVALGLCQIPGSGGAGWSAAGHSVRRCRTWPLLSHWHLLQRCYHSGTTPKFLHEDVFQLYSVAERLVFISISCVCTGAAIPCSWRGSGWCLSSCSCFQWNRPEQENPIWGEWFSHPICIFSPTYSQALMTFISPKKKTQKNKQHKHLSFAHHIWLYPFTIHNFSTRDFVNTR